MAIALTTFDNPYNPFTEFDKWHEFDMSHGYCSNSYLDRIANTSDSLTDEQNEEEIERAIDEILKFDSVGIYRKFRDNSVIEPEIVEFTVKEIAN